MEKAERQVHRVLHFQAHALAHAYYTHTHTRARARVLARAFVLVAWSANSGNSLEPLSSRISDIHDIEISLVKVKGRV